MVYNRLRIIFIILEGGWWKSFTHSYFIHYRIYWNENVEFKWAEKNNFLWRKKKRNADQKIQTFFHLICIFSEQNFIKIYYWFKDKYCFSLLLILVLEANCKSFYMNYWHIYSKPKICVEQKRTLETNRFLIT